jgi:hypothetical protein
MNPREHFCRMCLVCCCPLLPVRPQLCHNGGVNDDSCLSSRYCEPRLDILNSLHIAQTPNAPPKNFPVIILTDITLQKVRAKKTNPKSTSGRPP